MSAAACVLPRGDLLPSGCGGLAWERVLLTRGQQLRGSAGAGGGGGDRGALQRRSRSRAGSAPGPRCASAGQALRNWTLYVVMKRTGNLEKSEEEPWKGM